MHKKYWEEIQSKLKFNHSISQNFNKEALEIPVEIKKEEEIIAVQKVESKQGDKKSGVDLFGRPKNK